MLAIMLSRSSAFRDMVVHCVLFLFADLAVRTAEIIVCLSTTAAGPNFLERLATTTHLGITCEAITNILGLLGFLGFFGLLGWDGGHLLIDSEKGGLINCKGRCTRRRRRRLFHFFAVAAPLADAPLFSTGGGAILKCPISLL